MGLPFTSPDKGIRISQPLSEGTTTNPKDLGGNVQPANKELPYMISNEGAAKTTSFPKGPRGDKDSEVLKPPTNMEPQTNTITDLLGTGGKYQLDKSQSTRLRMRLMKVRKTFWELAQHKEDVVSYADLEASIEGYYEENVDHMEQMDKVIDAAMNSLEEEYDDEFNLKEDENINEEEDDEKWREFRRKEEAQIPTVLLKSIKNMMKKKKNMMMNSILKKMKILMKKKMMSWNEVVTLLTKPKMKQLAIKDELGFVIHLELEFPAQSVRSSNAVALDSPYLLVLITKTSQSRQHGSKVIEEILSRCSFYSGKLECRRSIKFRGGLLGIKCTRHSHCQERLPTASGGCSHCQKNGDPTAKSLHCYDEETASQR
nr:hypothetical protein [Tanacetum cinerariifolium]